MASLKQNKRKATQWNDKWDKIHKREKISKKNKNKTEQKQNKRNQYYECREATHCNGKCDTIP